MRPFVPTPIRWLTALLVAGFAMTVSAQPSSAARPASGVNFTEPAPATVSTNQAEETGKPFNLRGLDATIRKPFELFNASDSFGGTRAAPAPVIRHTPPSPQETRRINDLIDRKRNWAFLTPQEIYGIQTPEELLNVPEYGADGERKQPRTALERYMERTDNTRATALSNQINSDVLARYSPEAERAEGPEADGEKSPLLSFLAEPQSATPGITGGTPDLSQSLLNPTLFPERSPGASLFNFSPDQPAPAELPEGKESVQEISVREFNKLWSPRASPGASFNAGFDLPTPVTESPYQPFSLGAFPSEGRGASAAPRSPLTPLTPDVPPATFGVAVPSFTPAFSAPPAELAPPPPAMLPSAPVSTPRYLPSAPVFEIPNRKF